MVNTLRRCLAALVAGIVMLPTAYVQAAPEFMPVDQLVKGMHGTARTVVSGSQIEEFGVEILGVMKQKGPSGDLILVRTYGDVIERTGGIAQGMSGSPVYINGKLVGAIAYGWSLTDHKIGMVTPIADMLKLWELNDGQAPLQAPAATVLPGDEVSLDDKVATDDEAAPEDEAVPGDEAAPEDEAVPGDEAAPEDEAVPGGEAAPDDKVVPGNELSTPLMVSGFGQQALQMLTDKLKPYNLTPYAVNSMMSDDNNGIVYKTVEPGSTVGVQLVRGDVSVGALGTVTYVEGDKILAFGHPFLKRGKANYFLTDAEVYTTLNSLENSFKVGTATDTIGMINQDRGAGIAGQLGYFPGVVPLRISVTDKTLGKTNDLWAQVVQDEEMVPILSAVSVFSAIEKTSDRTGSGTAAVSFEISAAGIPGGIIKRENMFYTQGNIGELAVAEVHEALAILSGNQFSAVNIMDVKVNVAVDSERRTATIAEAKASMATAKPGDKVDIAVKLNPFRGQPTTRHITYTVPKEQQPGTLMLAVRGGGMVSIAQLVGKRPTGEEDLSKLLFMAKPRPQSLDEAVNELVGRDRNNDIVVEAINMNMPGTAPDGQGKQAKTTTTKFENMPAPVRPETAGKMTKASDVSSEAAKAGKGEERKAYISTDYIIDGDTQVVLNITQ